MDEGSGVRKRQGDEFGSSPVKERRKRLDFGNCVAKASRAKQQQTF
jgi:hypothetical protein